MENSPKVKKALEEVFKELNALSPEELAAEIEKHKDGDLAHALRYAWAPHEDRPVSGCPGCCACLRYK